jgi:hypothetical protein
MAIEVEDNVAELGKLALKLSTGKNRDKFLTLVAEDNPEIPIPEVKARKQIEEATAPLVAQIDALKAERQSDAAAKRLEERRKPVAHLGADELKRLEQFMIDKGIADYEIANREMKRLDEIANPKTEATGRYGRVTMPVADKDNMLYKDPAGFRSKTLHSMIDRLQTGKPS